MVSTSKRVADAGRSSGQRAENAGARLVHPVNLSLPAPLTLIHVDGPLFERVLINLLENAIKYAGPQAQIGIDAHVEDEHLQLDVWDNGPGIPQGQEQRVFDKFSRGTKSQRCRASGWGWPFVGR